MKDIKYPEDLRADHDRRLTIKAGFKALLRERKNLEDLNRACEILEAKCTNQLKKKTIVTPNGL